MPSVPVMSPALCQLPAWRAECLKISRINSQHGLQIKQGDNASLQAYLPFEIKEMGHPWIKYMAWGMGDVHSVCVCSCKFTWRFIKMMCKLMSFSFHLKVTYCAKWYWRFWVRYRFTCDSLSHTQDRSYWILQVWLQLWETWLSADLPISTAHEMCIIFQV